MEQIGFEKKQYIITEIRVQCNQYLSPQFTDAFKVGTICSSVQHQRVA